MEIDEGFTQKRQRQQQQHNGILPANADDATFQVANPLDNSLTRTSAVATTTTTRTTTRQRFAATFSRNSGGNSGGEQFVNRPLCRTPPPLYNHLPSTPPPSYTPRHIDKDVEQRRRLQAPEVFPSDRRNVVVNARATREDYVEVVAVGVEQQRQLAEQCLLLENATNRNVRRTATAAETTQRNLPASLSSQQQQRRRRRLQLLEQQHLSNINATNTDSSSNNSGGINYHNNNNGNTSSSDSDETNGLQQRRHRFRRTRPLRDAYCPDLLHACSLILHQQQQQTSGDSSVGSFTDTLPELSYSSDYVEIDEIQPVQLRQELITYRDGSNIVFVREAKSTPELRAAGVYCNAEYVALNVNSEDIQNQRRRLEGKREEMGQNLSLRRPRISLTWVLREQQQQQQQQQQSAEADDDNENKPTNSSTTEAPNNNNGYVNGFEVKNQHQQHRTQVVPTQLETTTTTKKRYRIKQLPVGPGTDPLNGYATTPTAHTTHIHHHNIPPPQKFFSNQNLLDFKDKSRAPSKELLFVCTPQRLPKSYESTSESLVLAKKRNEIRKKLAAKIAALQAANNRTGDGAEAAAAPTAVAGAATTTTTGSAKSKTGVSAANATGGGGGVLERDELKSLKGTFSEPSLIAASERHHRRHRHRKRRDRNRVQKFGYEISNVDEFLSKCSLAAPGNIPVVLSTASTLYQTRPGGYQVEVPLPLGMVVNAVFKNQNWLYVQTPHAEEGYVGYACCLPLGILPPVTRGTKPTPCWESNGDIFPRPCGNMTDSEKEIRLRGGTRSDGARTPRGKRNDTGLHNNGDDDTVNGNHLLHYSEHHVDKLYLRAAASASQPKLVEKAYAQLKASKSASIRSSSGINDEYVTLQQQQQQKSKIHVQKHMQQQQQQLQQLHQKKLNGPFITNGHNGQHLHPKNTNQSTTTLSQNSNANLHGTVLNAVNRKQHGLRQTLVSINADYTTESITLRKGEIVTLCECRESKDHRQWFYVKTRDGREGYIPAEVAGHGYL